MIDLAAIFKLLAQKKSGKKNARTSRLMDIYDTPPDLPVGAGVGIVPLSEPTSDNRDLIPGVNFRVNF